MDRQCTAEQISHGCMDRQCSAEQISHGFRMDRHGDCKVAQTGEVAEIGAQSLANRMDRQRDWGPHGQAMCWELGGAGSFADFFGLDCEF